MVPASCDGSVDGQNKEPLKYGSPEVVVNSLVELYFIGGELLSTSGNHHLEQHKSPIHPRQAFSGVDTSDRVNHGGSGSSTGK